MLSISLMLSKYIFWFGVNISQLFSQWYPLEPTRREKINRWNELATQNCSIYHMESCLYGTTVLYIDKIAPKSSEMPR